MKLKDKKIEILAVQSVINENGYAVETLEPICPPVWAYFRHLSGREYHAANAEQMQEDDKEYLDEYLLLGLLNSYIVKRQVRTKQFTRDVIDTLGKRIEEVVLPIPRNAEIKKEISCRVKTIIDYRISAREIITALSETICS